MRSRPGELRPREADRRRSAAREKRPEMVFSERPREWPMEFLRVWPCAKGGWGGERISVVGGLVSGWSSITISMSPELVDTPETMEWVLFGLYNGAGGGGGGVARCWS